MGSIRFILALSVVVWHIPGAPFRLMNGAVAVVLFFIISGFYMAMVLNETYAKDDGSAWVGRFYLARFLRLYPAYIVTVAVMLLWFSGTNGPSAFAYHEPMGAVANGLLVLANLSLVGQDVHQFLVRVLVAGAGPAWLLGFVRGVGPNVLNDTMLVAGQSWSLSAEIMFYAIAPLVMRSLWKTGLLLAFALGLRVYLLGYCGMASWIWGYYFTPCSLCFFLMGGMAYHLRRRMALPKAHGFVGWVGLWVFMGWFVQAAVTRGIVLRGPLDASLDSGRFWVFYCLFALAAPFIFEATKAKRWDRAIGDLSYPLYLAHGLVVGLVFYRWSGPRGMVWDAWAAVALSVMAAYALRMGVEVPVEWVRGRVLAGQAGWLGRLRAWAVVGAEPVAGGD